MKKDLTVGLVIRKDGRYQRKEMIAGVWKTFSANTPAEVWKKIADAKDEKEEKERIEKERSNAGPLFSEIAEEYLLVVQGMKSGTQKSYLPAVKRAVDEFGEYHMREIEPYMIAEISSTFHFITLNFLHVLRSKCGKIFIQQQLRKYKEKIFKNAMEINGSHGIKNMLRFLL